MLLQNHPYLIICLNWIQRWIEIWSQRTVWIVPHLKTKHSAYFFNQLNGYEKTFNIKMFHFLEKFSDLTFFRSFCISFPFCLQVTALQLTLFSNPSDKKHFVCSCSLKNVMQSNTNCKQNQADYYRRVWGFSFCRQFW